jgi:hypothetical protein
LNQSVLRAPAVDRLVRAIRIDAEQTFRRLDAPELLAEIAEGVAYVDGVRVTRRGEAPKKKAAA